jgi:hypothetical protein
MIGLRYLPAYGTRPWRIAGPWSQDEHRLSERLGEAFAEDEVGELAVLAGGFCDFVYLGVVDWKYLVMMTGASLVCDGPVRARGEGDREPLLFLLLWSVLSGDTQFNDNVDIFMFVSKNRL